jgi:hypothetical protein
MHRQPAEGNFCNEHGRKKESLLTTIIDAKVTLTKGNEWLIATELFGKHGKVKVKLSLCLTEHHAMKTYWGVEV